MGSLHFVQESAQIKNFRFKDISVAWEVRTNVRGKAIKSHQQMPATTHYDSAYSC